MLIGVVIVKISPIIDELSELFIDYPEIQIIKINGDKDGKMSKNMLILDIRHYYFL